MSTPFNKEELENMAVLDFTKLKQNKLENKEAKAEVPVNASESKSSNDVQSRIATARMYGTKEIKDFEKLTEEYCKAIEKMVLFGDVAPTIKSICIDKLLKGVIDPIFKGQNPYGIPEFIYKESRKDMYRQLVKKYADKE